MSQTDGYGPGLPRFSLPLRAALEGLKPHDHLCLIYETREEWRRAVVPFITIGLKRGEKCVYIVDTSTAGQVKGYLEQEGADAAAAEQKGQLVILSATEAYTSEGSFDPDRMISLLIEMTGKAVAEGYPSLRVTGEMTWALRGLPGSEKLIEYESKLNSFFPRYPCLAICQYDRWKFNPEVIKGVVMTHPLIVRGSSIYRNFYYIPPEDFANYQRAEREVQNLLNNLERERLAQERSRLFASVVEMSSQPLLISDPDRRIFMWNPAFARLVRYTEEELRELASYLRLTPPEWQEADQKAIDEISRTGQPQRYEKEYIRHDGSRVPVEILRHGVRDETGKIQYFFSFITDISERRLAQRSLRLSEARFRELFENMPSGVAVHEARNNGDDFTIIGFNRAAERIERIKREDVLGRSILKVFPGVKDFGLFEVFQRVWRTGVPEHHPVSLYKDERIAGWRENYVYRLPSNEVVAIYDDVTERKQIEDTLKESEERYRLMVETANDAIISWDADDKIIAWNKAAERMYGYNAAEAIGLYQSQMIAESHRKAHQEGLRRAAATGKLALGGRTVSGISLRKDGTEFPVELSINATRIAGRTVFTGIIRDITERLKAEQKLKESEERFRSVLELANDAVAVYDSSGNVVFWNRAAEMMHGYSSNEMAGKPFATVIPPRLHQRFAEALIRTVTTGELRHGGRPFETRHIKRDGTEFPVEISTSPWKAGDKTFVTTIMRDLTERRRAEETIRYQAGLLDQISEAVISVDSEGRIKSWNRGAERMFGRTLQEAVGIRDEGPREVEYVGTTREESIRQTFATGNWSGEVIYRPRNGSKIHARVSRTLIRDQDGKPAGWVSICHDITALKEAENHLRASEERLRAIIDSACDAIVTFDSNGDILSWNQAAEKLFGYTADEIIGSKFSSIAPPKRFTLEEHHQKMLEAVRRGVLTALADRTADITARRKDGSEFPAELSLSMWEAAGKTFFTAIIRDITQRKKAEELFRLLAEKSPVGVWIATRRQYRYVNSKLLEYTGYNEAELLRMKRKDLIWPEDHNRVMWWSHDTIHGKNTTPIEYRLKRKDGGFRWVLEMCIRIDYDGKPSACGYCIDITQYREAESRALEYEQLARTRSEVLSLVSHELRTPLAAIKGYSTMLLDYEKRLKPSEKHDYLVSIDKSAERLTDLVNHLLDVSRLEAGLLTLEKAPSSISKLVAAAVAEIRIRISSHRFVLSKDARLPRLNIDPRRIRQVLDNLLENAVKYSAKGTIVTVNARRNDSEVVISVTDRGQGIPPEELPRLFERAHGIKKRLTPGASGLGLGLNLCKGLVEAHGGRIWAESEFGKGSTFYFALPVKETK